MTTYEGKTFFKLRDRDSARAINDMVFVNCAFDNCSLSLTESPQLRSTIRNVELSNCTSVNCGIGPAVIEDVIIDGLKTNDLLIVWGALFKHVTLKGKIGKIKMNLTASFWDPGAAAQRPFDLARLRFYETGNWALDISEAEFMEFDLHGVPAQLVRRDPSTQVVVTREKALRPEWRMCLSPANTYWPLVLDMFIQDGEPDIVLVAPKGKPKRDLTPLVVGLDELRKAGVAEPD